MAAMIETMTTEVSVYNYACGGLGGGGGGGAGL